MFERNFRLFLLFYSVLHTANAQFTPQTYPDPRIDPASCHMLFPSQVCDPSEILTAEQRGQLNEKIQRLQQITANIRNTSPPCVGSQQSNLYIMVALMERLGTLPFESADVQKFTNLLRSKYQNYPDIGACDTMVLLVNSRADRQVFTVAGRDAKLTREVLQSAFHRNLVHFRSQNYAMGLEGMIEQIVSAYNSAHIVQVPQVPHIHTPTEREENVRNFVEFFDEKFAMVSLLKKASKKKLIIQLPSLPVSSSVGQFAAVHGVRQKPELQPIEKFDYNLVDEKDRVWVMILAKASARCGNDPSKIGVHVRAIVEEAMSLSLKLISDSRYNQIEEQSQDANNGPEARSKAWENANQNFIDNLWHTYGSSFPKAANTCPEYGETSTLLRML